MLSPERTERLQGHMATARRRLDLVRSYTGRLATVAGTATATAGFFTPDLLPESLLATVVTAGAGLLILPTWKAQKYEEVKVRTDHTDALGGFSVSTRQVPTHQVQTARALYAAPGAALFVVLSAELMVSGFHWGEAVAVAVWSAGTWWLRPARAARHMLVPPLPASTPAAEVEAVHSPLYDHPAAQWWAEEIAVEGGPAPDTALEGIEQTGQRAMRAIIRSTIPGQPVPDISKRRLSALMDIPEADIEVGPVPGRGASVQLLTVGTPDAAQDARTVWATRIAPLAMPGAVITEMNFGFMATTTKEDA